MADCYWLQFRKCCPTLFSLRKLGGKSRTALPKEMYYRGSQAHLSFGDLLYPHTNTSTHTQTHTHTPSRTHTHTAERHLSWQTLWSVLRTHCSCRHCWNTAVTERLSAMTAEWRLATGKYVTASLGFTSHPYTCFSLACMIQPKMFAVNKRRHTWQWPALKWMESKKLSLCLDSVHKPNLNLDLVVQEAGRRLPCGWLCQTEMEPTGCPYREFNYSQIQKQNHFLLNLISAGISVSHCPNLNLLKKQSHTHTASLHETSNIDKVPF